MWLPWKFKYSFPSRRASHVAAHVALPVHPLLCFGSNALAMSFNQVRRAGDVVQQSRAPRARRFFEPENLQRHNYTCDSSENPESSDSIFNAIKVTTPDGSFRCSGSAYDMGPVMEEGLAANIAMFISAGSSHDEHSSTERRPGRRPGQKAGTVWWRGHMLSDRSLHRTPPLGQRPLTETVSTTDATQILHQRAMSLDAVDGNRPHPRWPGNLGSAVATVQPAYPPQERQPTPPGLPSFNTPEAVYCSAQFLVGQNGVRHPRNTLGDGQRTNSYGDTFRRFLGLSPSTQPRQSGWSAVGIGRAEDGTVVHGRFPYRHSGHGINLARQLPDHPFHQNNLPMAEPDTGESTQEIAAEATSAKDPGSRPRGHTRLYAPPRIGRLWPFSDGRSLSTPSSAISPRPRKPARSIALLGPPGAASQQDGSFRAAPSTSAVEASVQAVGHVESHRPSTPSQQQSVFIPTGPGEDADQESIKDTHTVSDLLSWLLLQMYLYCCLGGHRIHESRDDAEALEAVTSRETYVTARENRRSGQCSNLSWVPSLWSFAWPGAAIPSQSAS